jgi:crotonobetainyl-CoA:carnitine CoA-transferase CaiB-like acyl-CoA transferase
VSVSPSLDPLAVAWAALTAGDPGAPAPDPLEVTGANGHLPSHLPVEDVAIACAGTALLAAAALHQQRGARAPAASVERAHLAAAVRSESYFRRDGRPAGASFAPLSRFWRTADGAVRTHANYPWHRAALLTALGLGAPGFDAGSSSPGAPGGRGVDPDAVAAAIAATDASDLEERVFAAGGVAAAVRTLDDWRTQPQGRAVSGEPLIGHHLVGAAAARPRVAGRLPADGIRVLDLTRVIAGPVCTRFLAAMGAEVLRIDPPGHPDLALGAPADTLLGKRSALLDLATDDGLAALHALVDRADVVVHGYRPGSLDRFGLGAGDLAARHPGLVIVRLDAWGHTGPWAGRRGFDSIVQAACGIAMAESVDGVVPGALPCQLLDHGTGYLAAAAALDGLRRQAAGGGTHLRSLSLARTASWLVDTPVESACAPSAATDPTEHPPWLTNLRVFGPAGGPPETVTVVTPPGRLDGRPLAWPEVPTGYGASSPAWAPG